MWPDVQGNEVPITSVTNGVHPATWVAPLLRRTYEECVGEDWLERSRDAGATWESLKFPVQPNSAIWTVCIPASAPDTMFCASRYGYLYRSDDGGDSWRKLWREFGEVSSVLWIPQ